MTKQTAAEKALLTIIEEEDDFVPDGEYIDHTGEPDELSPLNDKFHQDKRWIEKSLKAAAARLSPIQRETARLYQMGQKTVKIAETLQIAPQTVRKHLKLDKTQEYMLIAQQYHSLLSGFTYKHKEAMLQRIAMREEIGRPSIAIAAIQTSNNMQEAIAAREDRLKGVGTGTTTIIINPETMPQTALDKLPTTVDGDFTEVPQ